MSEKQHTGIRNVCFCLLCYQASRTDGRKFEEETNKLKDQIFAVFLLRNILEIPKSFCENLLTSKGNPSQWIFCCPSCSTIIHDLHQMFLELTTIQTKYDSLRRRAKLILETSKSITRTSCDENVLSNQMLAADEIRRFIFSDNKDSFHQIRQDEMNRYNERNDTMCPQELYIKNETREIEQVEEIFHDFGSEPVDDHSDEENQNFEDSVSSSFEKFKKNSSQNSASKWGPGEIIGIDCPKAFGDENWREKTRESQQKEEKKFVAEDNISWSSIESNFSNHSDSQWEPNVGLNFGQTNPTETSLSPFTSTEWKCSLCSKTFKILPHLKRHEKRHKGIKPYVCSECGKAFSDKSYLNNHLKVHTGEKPFSCTICGKNFSRKINLNSHLRVHSGEKPYVCTICGKGFSQLTNLKKHTMNFHTEERPFGCSECGKTFVLKAYLIKHMKTHSGEKPFKCSMCEKAFSLQKHLDSHSRIHTGEKPFVCTICGKAFRWSLQLTAHSRSHTGEKPYKCTVCEKTFNRKNTLNVHLKTHTEGRIKKDNNSRKKLKCSFCNRRFQCPSELNTHQNIHTGETAFKCSECGKAFALKTYLTMHMAIHKGEKPFKCSVCEKAFTFRQQLISHSRIHTGEKPYVCTICGKAFSQLTSLKTHSRTHAAERPFNCSVCEKSFTQKCNFDKHVLTHSKD